MPNSPPPPLRLKHLIAFISSQLLYIYIGGVFVGVGGGVNRPYKPLLGAGNATTRPYKKLLGRVTLPPAPDNRFLGAGGNVTRP